MNIDSNTINVLKNFAKINSSILVNPGTTIKTVASNKTILGIASGLNEFDTKFAIYNLDRFISTLSLFSNPDITFEDKYLVISDGKKKTRYFYAAEDTIVKPPEKEINLPSVDVEFKLPNDTFNDVVKASGVLGSPEIVVSGDGEKIYLEAGNTKDISFDVYSVEIGETDKNFKCVFKPENLKILPGDYEVSICSKGISKFVGQNFPFDIKYFIAVEQHSEF